MDSTGGSNLPKAVKKENGIPSDHFRFFPSIQEQGLGEKTNKKKLQSLFDRYLKPQQNDAKSLDIQKEWGKQFKEGTSNIAKKDLQEETMFLMDTIIYYLYHDIITDRTKYPKSVPFVDLPIEMIETLIKRAQKCFEDEKPLVQFEAPVKIFGDIHGQYCDLINMFKEMADKNKNEQNDYILSKNTRYLFMGDYVNRGKQSCEVMCLLLALKVRYPETVIILRGNHES